LIRFNEKNLQKVEIEKKKLKDRYPKLTRFKVWVPYFKSDEISNIINEVFPSFF
jgi:hypothetical protein